MKEERLPKTELDLYLKTLEDSLAEHVRLHPQIQLFGLPVEEWSGLRRDFHALGVSSLLLGQMHKEDCLG